MLELSKLMVDTRSVWLDYPGAKGFKVEIAMLSRKKLTKLRKDCTHSTFDRKARITIEELDEDKFVAEFTKATVKNWKGLTLKHLQSLVLIEVDEDQDMEEEMAYSLGHAEGLVSSSTEFDTWLNEVVFDLDNFRTGSED
jgi:hypothetical protein